MAFRCPLVAFQLGHRWATWPTYPWNRLSLLGGGGPRGEALVSRVAHTSDGAFGAVRAVHEASLHSIMGALVAPQAGRFDTGLHVYGVAGARAFVVYPPEARSRSYAWAASDICPDLLEGLPAPPQAPAQWSVALALGALASPLRRTGRQTPERACGSLPVQRLKKRRNWLSGSPINEENWPSVSPITPRNWPSGGP